MPAIPPQNSLLLALRNPTTLTTLHEAAWEGFLLHAQHSKLLARFAIHLAESDLLEEIPDKARLRLEEARTLAERNQTNNRFEVNRIVRALYFLETPIILLKGAAYLLADLPRHVDASPVIWIYWYQRTSCLQLKMR